MTQIPITKDQRDQLAQSWQYRALDAARNCELMTGSVDPIFRILCASMAKDPPEPPYYGWGIISEKNTIVTNVYLSLTEPGVTTTICSLKQLKDNLNRLADATGFTFQERTNLFNQVNQWIRYNDTEGKANLAHDRIPKELMN